MSEFNGWSNRATWALALHLDNSARAYAVSQGWRDGLLAEEPARSLSLANRVSVWFEGVEWDVRSHGTAAARWRRDLVADVGDGLVDFDEVACHLLDRWEDE